MRDSGIGVAPPDIDNPHPKQRFIDQICPPECLRETGPLTRRFDQDSSIYGRDRNGRNGHDAVIHTLEDRDTHVEEIVGEKVGGDLPRPFRQRFVAGSLAVQYGINVLGLLALAHDVVAFRDHSCVGADRFNGAALL